MKTWGLLLAALQIGFSGLSAAGQTDELFTRRFAFLVGANSGGKERVTLKYAVDDALAIQRVLEDMGGVLAGDSRFLADPGRGAFFQEIKALAEEVARARENFRRVEVIFYYSGHSDEENLFLGEDRVSYAEFRDLITTLKADVRIAIIDSCASGTLTLPKGVIKRSPFLMDTAYDMKGYAFMTSSSASEAAQESSRLKRSYFTHNLVSGMRGAADMNLDGRITLNEAYQFAFDGTLTQTEKTMAGPQHPSYHIQMSGTGDVVITEIWKSTAVLVLKKDISGRIYIHNRDGVLVVEMKKTEGREISIGLDAGDYTVINIDNGATQEATIFLENGKSLELGRDKFQKTDKIPTTLRGDPAAVSPDSKTGTKTGRWRIETFGGLASMSPEDLNLRATFDDMFGLFYNDDYFEYQKARGQIRSFTKTNTGGKPRYLKHSLPFGVRFRYRIAGWLDVSLGLSRFSKGRTSSFTNTYEVIGNDGLASVYAEEFKDYTLAAEGLIPSLGVYLGKRISPALRLEAFLEGGPLLAKCRYSQTYDILWSAAGSDGDRESPEMESLEEKGKGTGLALQAGARMDFSLTKRAGVFVEGGYAFQKVSEVSGPGTRVTQRDRSYWEGDWGIKQDVKAEPWGIARFLWPSNGWTIFNGTWWRARDFELDLSGFQLRLGVFYRF